MNKASKFEWKKFIVAVLINVIILLVALFVFHPFFEENDDLQLCMIAEGAFGNREWHLIYANVVLGKLYVLLGSIFTNIRWHIVLQYGFIFTGYVFLSYVLSKHKRGLFLSIVAILSTFYEMYVSIQYTKTAAFCCVAGFVLIFEYVRNKTSYENANSTVATIKVGRNSAENKLFIVIAYILIIYGSLLRPESFYIAAVPTLAAGIIELLRTKNIKAYLFGFVPVFVLVMLLSFMNTKVYSMDESWSEFMEYNKARMELNDYRYDILDYSKYSEELKKLNVSENDAIAILTYQFGDDEVLSLERFREIRAPFSNREFGYKTFANLFENLINELNKAYTLLMGIFATILVLVASIVTDRSKSSPGFIKDSMRKLAYFVMLIIFCGAATVYFQYSGRFSHRLIGAIFIPAIFVTAYIIDSVYIRDNDSKIVFGGNKNDITFKVCLIVSVILIGMNGLVYKANIDDFVKMSTINSPMLRELYEISKDKESLYVGDTFTFNDVYKYEVFNIFDIGQLENYVNCGSWYINSPITKQITYKYGYVNPITAIRSGDDNVFLLDNGNTECKLLFLKEHYGKVYEAVKLENRGGIDIYHVQEKDK